MSFRRWIRMLLGLTTCRPIRKAPTRISPHRRAYLRLQELETRIAPATLTVVNNTNDAALALDSLRAAVSSIEHQADANANIQRTGSYGTNDTIQFNLSVGQTTITLTSHDAKNSSKIYSVNSRE